MIDHKYHYRKAQAGEVKCEECKFSGYPYLPYLACSRHLTKHRPSYNVVFDHRVARNNTCDEARRINK